MKKFLLVTLTFSLAVPSVTYAHDHGNLTHKAKYLRSLVKREFGARAAGRDIIRYGLRGGGMPSKHQKAQYVRQLREILSPAPSALLVRTVGPPSQPPAGAMTPSYTGNGVLQSIAQCESGGNPAAISPDGTFRGKYQFDYTTWAGVGGSGDPAQ